MNAHRFQKIDKRPRWEGVIFPDVDYHDSRVTIIEAEPSAGVSDYIESIWFMSWDINDPQGMQGILVPNPCAKLVILQDAQTTYRPLVIGVREKAEIFTYQGQGAVVGFDFRPGGLYPIFKRAMTDWPERGLLADELLANLPPVPKAKWNDENLSEWLNNFEDFLVKTVKNSEEHNYPQILPLIEGVLEERFRSPEEMAQESGMSVRTLQRVFQKEIGLSPRDVLRIARFNRAIRHIGGDDFKAFTEVALASGYFDQPHMVNEFQKMVANPPSKFKRYL